MKQSLLIAFLFYCCTVQHVHAQILNRAKDSTVFVFDGSDSFSHRLPQFSVVIDTAHSDTSNTYLWQPGRTAKPFFASGGVMTGIMTDTSHAYPVNANSWFVLKINLPVRSLYNAVIYFDHKYQTTKNRDGGVVEYSIDSGKTWDNVRGLNGGYFGFDNFYADTDKLTTGQPAFSGSSHSSWFDWETSAFSLPMIVPTRTSDIFSGNSFWTRFRFISDNVTDTLDGWLIGSIKVKPGIRYGSVSTVNDRQALTIYPNPSANGIFQFPAMEDERDYKIAIYDLVGQEVLQQPYKHTVDMSMQPPGVYFYKVADGQRQYSGKLVVE